MGQTGVGSAAAAPGHPAHPGRDGHDRRTAVRQGRPEPHQSRYVYKSSAVDPEYEYGSTQLKIKARLQRFTDLIKNFLLATGNNEV